MARSSIGAGAHRLYHKLFHRRAALEVMGIRRRFVASTPQLHRRIVRAGGERAQLERFVSALKRDDVVWDVGSFIGMFAVFSEAAVGENGRVYAFEPEPRAAELLRRNCRLNRAAGIRVIEVALGDVDGKAEVFSARESENAIHSLRAWDHTRQRGAAIAVRRGDQLVSSGHVRPPNVVKMDVEGGEFQSLMGMRETIRSDACRMLFLELHPQDLPRFGASESDVRACLSEAGFRVTQETPRGTEWHLFCEK